MSKPSFPHEHPWMTFFLVDGLIWAVASVFVAFAPNTAKNTPSATLAAKVQGFTVVGATANHLRKPRQGMPWPLAKRA